MTHAPDTRPDTVRIALLGAVTAVLLPAAGLLHRALAPADLGLPTAAALGARPQRTGAAALVLGAVLAAAATAAVGPLAFVALLAGPAAQGLTGGRPSLACSALTGAAMVVLADLLAAEAAAKGAAVLATQHALDPAVAAQYPGLTILQFENTRYAMAMLSAASREPSVTFGVVVWWMTR